MGEVEAGAELMAQLVDSKILGRARPVSPLWERLPAHISSLMAWRSQGSARARAPQRITVRSSPWAISSVSRLPVTQVK